MSCRMVLIGAGAIAGNHMEALVAIGKERAQAVAVADTAPGKAQRLADAYGLRAYVDYREMIERERPDAAIVMLPHFLHKEAAVFCAKRGCHLLLEKPMAIGTAECDAIIAAVRASGVKLLVGHIQHYFQENIAASRIIRRGDLGPLVMINDTRHGFYFSADRPAWFLDKRQSGGGMLSNIGAHSIDKVQWLGGGRIRRVKASLSYYGGKPDIEGSGLVFATNEHGIPATIAQSGYPGAPRIETELVCGGGMLKTVAGGGLWISTGQAYEQVPLGPAVDPFVLQLEDLLGCIEADKEPACTMTYARSVVAVLESIYLSQETGVEQAVNHME